jgi:hypothetical protein
MKKIHLQSTRPYAEFPITFGAEDDDTSYEVRNIIHGLNYVRYLEKELPNVKVIIDHISTTQIRIILRYSKTEVGANAYTREVWESYRIGISPNNPKSDGVLTGQGKKYASTFSEFVEKIRNNTSVVIDAAHADNPDDEQL